MATHVVQSEQQVLVGAAALVPPELPAVLSRFFSQRPVVEAAYLGWIVHPDGHAGYLLVVVAADHDEAMAGFGSLSIGEVTDGATVDVIVSPPGDEHMLAGIVPPFYTHAQ
jgi:hypothetical protein